MVYISKEVRKKVEDFLNNFVIPAIKYSDLDYYKIIDGVTSETKVNREIVNSIIDEYIQNKKLHELRLFTIPPEEVNEFLIYLKEKTKRDKETKQDLDNLDKQLKEVS